MLRAWDTALVRHIYDVHCIFTRNPALMAASGLAFAALVQGDVAEFGQQQPNFAADPLGVMKKALLQASVDQQTQAEYEQNLLPLVYGSFKPRFDDAFASFDKVAHTLLGAASQ